jgi:hypothetical protein
MQLLCEKLTENADELIRQDLYGGLRSCCAVLCFGLLQASGWTVCSSETLVYNQKTIEICGSYCECDYVVLLGCISLRVHTAQQLQRPPFIVTSP